MPDFDFWGKPGTSQIDPENHTNKAFIAEPIKLPLCTHFLFVFIVCFECEGEEGCTLPSLKVPKTFVVEPRLCRWNCGAVKSICDSGA
jgi:hypothetical protein